jgi:hypothetical protein
VEKLDALRRGLSSQPVHSLLELAIYRDIFRHSGPSLPTDENFFTKSVSGQEKGQNEFGIRNSELGIPTHPGMSAEEHVWRSVPVFSLSGESTATEMVVGSVNAKAGNSREAGLQKGALKE